MQANLSSIYEAVAGIANEITGDSELDKLTDAELLQITRKIAPSIID